MNKRNHQIFLAVIILIIAALACTGSDDTEVRTPTPGDIIPPEVEVTQVPEQDEPDDVVEPVEPTDEPEPTKPPLGSSRSNPAPVGSTITADGLSVTVIDVVRPADDIAIAGNIFNKPTEGKEFVMAELELECELSDDDICKFSSSDFSVVGNMGEISDAEWAMAGIERDMGVV
jgi:hypothetical protein